MALVGYDSSDDEDETRSQPESLEKDAAKEEMAVQQPATDSLQIAPAPIASRNDTTPPGPLLGPQSATIGPSLPPPGDLASINEAPLENTSILTDPTDPPQSPYSAARSLIHEMTLPSVPDFDIPPSPPGSPPAAIDKKFSQFLDLKKKGIHFNQKLEQSAALKNPNVMDKLMTFVELEGEDQYETTLPKELWNPAAFPDWAHREGLRKSREQVLKEREAQNASGNRKAPEFVPASNARKAG